MQTWAWYYDNRYFPLLGPYFPRTPEKPSALLSDVFIMLGHEAFLNSDKSVGIPEILGSYDQNNLANAMVLLGFPNPLSPDFDTLIGKPINWRMRGKIETEGIAFSYNQQVTEHISFGISWFFMHLFSRIDFFMEKLTQADLGLTDDELNHLDAIRRQMQQQLGFQAPTWQAAGISDFDMYVRCGKMWEYFLKFKRIDAGVRLGALLPSGVRRQLNNPASIPFGGDGLWGIYLAGDVEFELKEDWKVGLWLRMNQRFGQRLHRRIPIAGEQQLFGAVQGPVFIDAGPSFIVSPYVRLEDLRDGLGLHIQYTVIDHLDDVWKDDRMVPVPQAMFRPVFKFSEWVAEYITLTIFYDFARVRQEYCSAPIVSFRWDMPVAFFAAEGVSKTNRIALGIVFTF
jgi:hypothetical protein